MFTYIFGYDVYFSTDVQVEKGNWLPKPQISTWSKSLTDSEAAFLQKRKPQVCKAEDQVHAAPQGSDVTFILSHMNH